MRQVCDKHHTAMSLWESDRSGQTWMCGQCLTETAKELSREHVIEELEKIVYAPPGPDEPLIGRTLAVPDSLVKLALRQLRNTASTTISQKGKP